MEKHTDPRRDKHHHRQGMGKKVRPVMSRVEEKSENAAGVFFQHSLK